MPRLLLALLLCCLPLAAQAQQGRPMPSLQPGESLIQSRIEVQPDGSIILRHGTRNMMSNTGPDLSIRLPKGGILRPIEQIETRINNQPVKQNEGDELHLGVDNLVPRDYAIPTQNAQQYRPGTGLLFVHEQKMERAFTKLDNLWELELSLTVPEGQSIAGASVLVTLPGVEPEAVLKLSPNDDPGNFGPPARSISQGTGLQAEWIRPLDTESHLILNLSLPHHAITPPSAWDILARDPNMRIGLAGLGLMIVLQFVAWLALRFKGASAAAEPMPMPPEGVSPAMARFLKDRGKVTPVAFAAALASLEDQGLVEITEIGAGTGRYALVQGRRHELPRDLPQEERKIYSAIKGEMVEARNLHALMAAAQDSHMDHSNMIGAGTTLPVGLGIKGQMMAERTLWKTAGKDFAEALEARFGDRLLLNRKSWLWPALLVGLGTYGWLVSRLDGEGLFIGLFMTVWLSGWTFGTATLLSKVFSAWKFAFSGGIGQFIIGLIGAGFITAFATPFVFGWIAGAGALFAIAGPIVGATLVTVLLTHLFWRKRMTVLSDEGAKLYAQIKGWRDTMQTMARNDDDSLPGMVMGPMAGRQPSWTLALGLKPGPRWRAIQAALARKLGDDLSGSKLKAGSSD